MPAESSKLSVRIFPPRLNPVQCIPNSFVRVGKPLKAPETIDVGLEPEGVIVPEGKGML